MIKRTCAGFLAAMGIASLVFLASFANRSAADDAEEIKAAKEAVLKLAKMKAAEQPKAAEKAAKDHFIEFVMIQFKPRSRKGIGVGDKPNSIVPDSIELKIMAMARKTMSPAQLKKEAPDLIQMAEITKAIAEITYHQGPKKPMGAKTPAEWKKYTDGMKNGSVALIEALKKEDPAAVKAAVSNVNSACVNCHSDFRDS